MEKEKLRLKKPFGKKKQLETDLAHLSQEMYKRNLELAETNQSLSLMRSIDKLVLASHEELSELCQHIAKAIIDHSNYAFVALMACPPRKKCLQLLGWGTSYNNPPQIDNYMIEMDDINAWLAKEEHSHIIDLKKTSDKTIARILNDSPANIATLRTAIPLQALVVIKLQARNNLVGLMAVGLNQDPQEITTKQHTLLDRLSETVGIALDNKLLYDENQHVLKQLQKSNEKLKSLDETKDEFISMASHQLRTPLTSVKGYLSMVLEGDAGKITKAQQKLLDQAFVSSQRMVYLIADLLNVSRLRTGKFIIDAVPTNLAELVQGEIGQLIETAKSHNLTLTYKKPKNFPLLMLDETKIRQVVMNFADNAIYYTPSGGHIKVELEDKGKTVELRITDDGLGVPKAEQHHLFTKFYRAGNAKKARPDGTGLGLFMAKKVIATQGGAIIFHSQEGKGSTFGFVFNKAKLKPKMPQSSKK